jgi:hypothetical protein
MVLSAISALSAFPNEAILITVADTTPQLDGRLGISFVDSYYNYGDEKVKWNNYPLLPSDELDDDNSLTSLSPPFERVNMPDVFPLVYTVSGFTDHLHLDFQGGTDCINVYPSRPYPIITYDTNTKVLYISAGLLPLTAFPSNVKTEEFRKLNVATQLQPLPSSLTMDGVYKSTAVFGKTVYSYTKPFFNNTAALFIPLTEYRYPKTGYTATTNWSLYSEKINPSSFLTKINTSGTSFSATGDIDDYTTEYNCYWDRTVNALSYTSPTTVSNKDTLISPDIYYSNIDTGSIERLYITGNVDPCNSYINFARISSGLNYRQQLFIEPKDTSPTSPISAFFFPANTDVNVWYETSSYHINDIGSLSSTSFGSNYFAISAKAIPQIDISLTPANIPIWGYGADFSYNGQKAFTVNFIPSAGVIPTDLSSVTVGIKMVDNYYQTSMDLPSANWLITSQFTGNNTSNTEKLSAVNQYWFDPGVDVYYTEGEEIITTSAIKFINSLSADTAAVYNLNFATNIFWNDEEGLRKSYYQQPLSFTLNPDKAVIYLTQSNATGNSVDITGSVSPDYDETTLVQWSVSPPESVIIRNLEDSSIITPNTNIAGGTLSVRIENLGVDDTTVSLYVPQYDRSASTTWTPPDNIWSDVSLRVLGAVDDYNPINTGSISAFFVRNNSLFRVPTDATIRWSSTMSDPDAALDFHTQTDLPIVKNSTYPSTNLYSLIEGDFQSPTTVSGPKNVDFRVNCSVFNSSYSYDASRSFYLREYPENSNVFIDISSNQNPNIISSEYYTTVVYENSAIVNLIADIDTLNIPSSSVKWEVDNTLYTGSSIMLDISSAEVCVNISALDVSPSTGGFGKYNFYDSVCFYILSTLVPFEYISFPSINYLPTVNSNLDNYTSTYIAMSSYSACHTENIYFSALSGFDEYHWSVEGQTTITTTNTALVPIDTTSLGATNDVSVSAFNLYFPNTNPPSVYNTASSDGSLYNDPLTLHPFPPTTLTLSLDNNLVDMRQVTDRDVNFNAAFSVVDLSASTFQLVLSSTEGIVKRGITLFDNDVNFSDSFNYGEFDVFTIEENSLYKFNVFLEGSANKTVNGFDFCSEVQPITSNILTLTAFDGPDLSIWTSHNVLTTTENAVIYNTTFNTPLNPFTAFDFNDGNGTTTTQLGFGPFSASYSVGETTYTVSMTGYRSDGQTVSATWEDFFILEEGKEYDPDVNRNTSTPIELPYSLADVTISPNSWQFSETLNTSFDRMRDNINYLNAKCFLTQNYLPKYSIGTYGKYKGVTEWRFDEPLANLETNDTATRYDDMVKFGQYVLMVNNSKIEVRQDDISMTLLNTIETITDVEQIVNPTRIQILGDRIIVLDEAKNSIYVCSLDESDYSFKLSHYWGGIGSKNSRTKLNKPTDMIVLNDTIYVVDNDSDNIKVYNKFLNWTNNIQITDPLAIAGFDDTLFVLTTNGDVHRFENLIETEVFRGAVGTNIAYDVEQNKIYIASTDRINVFSENGTFINTIQDVPMIDIRNVAIQEKELFVLSNNIIIKMFDPLNYEKITSLETFESSDISYRIHPNEPVSSFIINDSINRLGGILSTLNDSLTSQVLKFFDNDDIFLYSTLSAATYTTGCSGANLGINELVSYETVNREIFKLYKCIEDTRDFIDGIDNYPVLPPVWTWIYHKIDKNQRPNLNRTPLSWEELSSANPAYSGITWNSIRFSTGYENNFPVNWRWVDLSSTCLNATTWSEMESGSAKDYTWEELEDPIPYIPPQFLFDRCK